MGRIITIATVLLAITFVATPDSASADDAVTVSGEYIEYATSRGDPTIGPFADIQMVFHAANLGPAGVACHAGRTEVINNSVTFTFDPAGGPAVGTGSLELRCEYHPGCGAVSRTMGASYDGVYDSQQQVLIGAVNFWSLDAESTSWGTGPDGTDQCLDRWTVSGESYTTNWRLSFAEEPAIGYQTALLVGGDPNQRTGFFTVSPIEDGVVSALGAPGSLSESTDGGPTGAEGTEEAAREVTPNADAGQNELDPADLNSSDIAELLVTFGLIFGIGAVAMLVYYLFRRRRTPLQEAARARAAQESAEAASAFFNSQATHLIQPGNQVWVVNPDMSARAAAAGQAAPSGAGPLPLSLETRMPASGEAGPYVPATAVDGVTVIFDPAHPGVAVTRTGAHVWISEDRLTPLPTGEFAPTHELIGSGSIHGQGETAGYAYPPGTPVQVLTTTGDRTLVRVDHTTEMWVPRSSVGPATAQIDP